LLRLLPAGATVAGRDSHPLEDSAFARRTLTFELSRVRRRDGLPARRIMNHKRRAGKAARLGASGVERGVRRRFAGWRELGAWSKLLAACRGAEESRCSV